MKKRLVFVMAAFLMVFCGALATHVKAADAAIEGKVVFHYQLWDAEPNYSDAGLWTWNTGAGGSQAPVTSTVTDSFGGVYEINLGAGADKLVPIIPLRKDITKDSRWDYRETPDGDHFFVDASKILDGSVEEIHVYYFQGGYQTCFVADPTVANVLIAYYDPANSYEANLGLHAWGSYLNPELESVAWASPAKVFVDGFKSPASVPGKIAHLKVVDPASAGFLVYAGDDATKKTPDQDTSKYISDLADLKAGDVRVLYVCNKTGLYGETATKDFIDSAFAFDFKGADVANQTGTYAANKTTVFANFTLAVATKVSNSETVIDEAGANVEYKEYAIPEGATKILVLHYNLGEGADYSTIGTYTWVAGKVEEVTKGSDTDSFGGVIVIPFTDAVGDKFEAVLLKAGASASGMAPDWAAFVKASTDNIAVDTSAFASGATRVDAFITQTGADTVKIDGGTRLGDKIGQTKVVTTVTDIDFSGSFKVVEKATSTEVAISAINYNKTVESANEFVLQLATELDNTKEYVLTYGEGEDQISIELDLDREAPVIEILGEEVIEVKLGSKWNQGLFPITAVTDDRDSNLDNKIYVKEGHGTLDTRKAGEYQITLCVEDTWGNVGEKTFTFVVKPIEGGCKNASGALYSVSLLGLALVFFRKRSF